MITVTKDFTFDAAHYLEDYVGPCANMHGHTYRGSVTIKPERNNAEDMVIDFKDLKEIIQQTVVNKFDHKVINEVVEYNPTAENMVADIAHTLIPRIPVALCLIEVKLWETSDSHATWSQI